MTSDAPFPRKDRFVTSWDELKNTDPPEMLVEGIVPRGQVTWLYGATGIGKSLIASAIAQAVAYGDPVFGTYPSKIAKVLWLDYENGAAVHLERLTDAMFQLDDVIASANYFIGDYPESITTENASDLLYEIGKYDIGFLVIDSAGVGIEGDSNSADTYADLAQHLLNPLKKMGVTVLILDNMGKDSTRGAIGSSRKAHEAAAIWQLSEMKVSGVHTLTCKKKRTQGILDAVRVTQQLEPLRYISLSGPVVSAIDLTVDQQNVVLFLDGLDNAQWFGVRELKQSIRDGGMGMKDEAMQQAIKWWNKGEHDAIK